MKSTSKAKTSAGEKASGGRGSHFLGQVKRANQNVICTSREPKTVRTHYLFERSLRIPVFQRRYAWNVANWMQASKDVFDLAEGKKRSHFFGRMTCVSTRSAIVVVDGQQRSTTLSLFLAACRDVAEDIGKEDVAGRINSILFFNKRAKMKWEEDGVGDAALEEFCATWCRLVPTICDRVSYLRAIVPRARAKKILGNEMACPREGFDLDRLVRAKRFFVQRLKTTGKDVEGNLRAVIHAILYKIEWLLFPIDVGTKKDSDDGTENLGVIFERLALREAMFTRPSNQSMYAKMAGVDFVRNLLLGGFSGSETLALKMYKMHWLPIEREASAIGRARGDACGAMALEEMIAAYLEANHRNTTSAVAAADDDGGGGGRDDEHDKEGSNADMTATAVPGRDAKKTSSPYHSHISKMIGGELYADFRTERKNKTHGIVPEEDTPAVVWCAGGSRRGEEGVYGDAVCL
eukprot:g3852.t1